MNGIRNEISSEGDLPTQPKELEDPSYDFDEYDANPTDEIDEEKNAEQRDLLTRLLMADGKLPIQR